MDDRRPYQWPNWSPDGTKIELWADIREPGNEDIYVVVFKKPGAPLTPAISGHGSTHPQLTWRPATQHREIKEYEIHRSDEEAGAYSQVGAISERYTYLDVSSKIGRNETTLVVDDTWGFPDQGTIEVEALSSEFESELVSYTGKTSRSFTGCTRGAHGTQPAEHWNDSFVWRHTGSHGYGILGEGRAWYKVRSVEWSGLKSSFSDATVFPADGGTAPVP